MHVAAWLLLSASAAAALAAFGWPLELFAHFRWQLGVAAGLVLAAALVLGEVRSTWIAALALALPMLPLLNGGAAEAAGRAAACTGGRVDVATLNLWYRPGDYQRARDWLETAPADVVVVQELTPAWVATLAPLESTYPYQHFHARTDPYGLGVLSRWPLASVEAVDLAGDGLPSLLVRVETEAGPVQVLAMHTAWPVMPDLQALRDRALERAARLVRGAAVPTLLAGDLNLTPYAPAFPRLLRDSGLRDALEGRAWRPTWQAGLWPLALPIDHVLVPPDACVIDARIGPELGSDHRPVTVRLRFSR